MRRSRRIKQLWKTACASALIGCGIASLGSIPAQAQNATWDGPGNDYNSGANWDPNTVPTDDAIFGENGPNDPTITAMASINRIIFNGNAQADTITNNSIYDINGDGIVNNSDFTQNVVNQGTLNFNNNASIQGDSSVLLTNLGGSVNGGGIGVDANLNFNNTSAADNTTINNLSGSTISGGLGGDASLTFNNDSHADDSTINNNAGGTTGGGIGGIASLNFNNDSHADNATIGNVGGGTSLGGIGGAAILNFNTNSHADGATFTNSAGSGDSGGGPGIANLNFNAGSHADNSTFFNNGGSSTISGTGGSASITFNSSSHADNSTFFNTGGDGVDNGVSGGTGGSATITFTNAGTVGSTFINTGGNSPGVGGGGLGVGGRAVVTFSGSSTAGNSTITNSGSGDFSGLGGTSTGGTGETVFNNATSAGTSVITNNASGAVFFNDVATADDATIINNLGGLVDTRGIVILGIGSLSGAGDVFLGDGTVTLGKLNQDDEISGVIQNGTPGATGSIIKTGTGTLILLGANIYTGTTTVNDGTLQLDGSITSIATVGVDGTFSGTGTSSALLTNSGFVAPGNDDDPFGKLTVNTFTNTNDGRYVARVNETQANRLNAANSNLDGQVFVQGRSLFLNENQYDYIIIDNSVGQAGTFDSVDPDSELPFYIDATLSYPTNDVNLTLTRNSDVPDFTENQNAVAQSLDGPGNTNSDFDSIFAALNGANNAGQFQGVLNIVSGDALTSYQNASQGASNRFNERLGTQSLLQQFGASGDGRFAKGKSPRMAYDGTHYRALFAAAGDRAEANTRLEAGRASRTGIWATIARAGEDTDSDGNGPDFNARATEFQVGVNRSLSTRTTVGISVGKSDGSIDINDRSANGDLDTTSIGAFLRHEGDKFYATGQLSYSRHDIDSERETFGGQAKANFDARTVALSGEVGKRMQRGKYSIEPNISLKLSNTHQDDFEESGPGALNVDSSSYNTRRLGLGVRLINRDATARVRPHLFLGYEREFGDQKAELTNQLTGLSSFDVSSSELGRNIFSIRAGANARISDRFSVVGELGGSWRSNQDSKYVYGGVKYGW